MRANVREKYNGFSSGGRAIFGKPAALTPLILLAGALLATGAAASPHQASSTGASESTVIAARDYWSDQLQEFIELWLRHLRSSEPPAADPILATTQFNDYWASHGLPQNLTDSDRMVMRYDLDRLESHLAADPGHLSPEVAKRTRATIAGIREALHTPNPVTPGISL